jgi:hypothetical protein
MFDQNMNLAKNFAKYEFRQNLGFVEVLANLSLGNV